MDVDGMHFIIAAKDHPAAFQKVIQDVGKRVHDRIDDTTDEQVAY